MFARGNGLFVLLQYRFFEIQIPIFSSIIKIFTSAKSPGIRYCESAIRSLYSSRTLNMTGGPGSLWDPVCSAANTCSYFSVSRYCKPFGGDTKLAKSCTRIARRCFSRALLPQAFLPVLGAKSVLKVQKNSITSSIVALTQPRLYKQLNIE